MGNSRRIAMHLIFQKDGSTLKQSVWKNERGIDINEDKGH